MTPLDAARRLHAARQQGYAPLVAAGKVSEAEARAAIRMAALTVEHWSSGRATARVEPVGVTREEMHDNLTRAVARQGAVLRSHVLALVANLEAGSTAVPLPFNFAAIVAGARIVRGCIDINELWGMVFVQGWIDRTLGERIIDEEEYFDALCTLAELTVALEPRVEPQREEAA